MSPARSAAAPSGLGSRGSFWDQACMAIIRRRRLFRIGEVRRGASEREEASAPRPLHRRQNHAVPLTRNENLVFPLEAEFLRQPNGLAPPTLEQLGPLRHRHPLEEEYVRSVATFSSSPSSGRGTRAVTVWRPGKRSVDSVDGL